MVKDIFPTKKTLNLRGELYNLDSPKVMGILNVTPDSFFDGGKYLVEERIIKRIQILYEEGTDFIDIGGYSTRPGAEEITEEEEIKRIKNAIELVTKYYPNAFISIDTFRSGVAQVALDKGACMVNDITGGSMDPKMLDAVAKHNVPLILMHMRGTPSTMQTMTNYTNLITDLVDELKLNCDRALNKGINDIIIDPGFGFAKTLDQNYELLKNLDYFKVLGFPMLAGISRKSMIYKHLKISPEDALNGTSVLNTFALLHGANILRVHDVKAAKEVIQLVGKLESS